MARVQPETLLLFAPAEETAEHVAHRLCGVLGVWLLGTLLADGLIRNLLVRRLEHLSKTFTHCRGLLMFYCSLHTKRLSVLTRVTSKGVVGGYISVETSRSTCGWCGCRYLGDSGCWGGFRLENQNSAPDRRLS